MTRFRHLILLAALAALAVPAAASAAADTPVVNDPAATEITALDSTIVWVTKGTSGKVLMQKTGNEAPKRVATAPAAKIYSDIDLGHDAHGKLALTYFRCSSFSKCTAYQDNLKGHRSSFKKLKLSHCKLSTAPAVWGKRTAAGFDCTKNKRNDTKRSGLYVKTGTKLKRLKLPHDAVKFDTTHVTSVDIKGTRIGAIVQDIYTYTFSESVNGNAIRSAMTADQEGDDDGFTVGLSVNGSPTWALTTFAHAGDPNQSELLRMTPPSCTQLDITKKASESDEGFPYTDMSVDGSKVYLLVPGSGIVRHTFAPDKACTS